jgi:hypothetical protein
MTRFDKWAVGTLLGGLMGIGYFATNPGPYQTTMETPKVTQAPVEVRHIPNSVTSGAYVPGDFIGTKLSPNQYLVNPKEYQGQ